MIGEAPFRDIIGSALSGSPCCKCGSLEKKGGSIRNGYMCSRRGRPTYSRQLVGARATPNSTRRARCSPPILPRAVSRHTPAAR